MSDQQEKPAACLCQSGATARITELLGALANEQRMLVVALLHEVGELSVGEMAQQLNVNRAALSRHLARLRELELLKTRRHGNRVYYALDAQNAPKLLDVLDICLTPAE